MTNKYSSIQDTVSFTLNGEHTIVNKTVKLIASITALVTGDTTEEALRADIRLAMKKIVDADWQFNNIQRSSDDSGFERVSLIASVRVNESENYNLKQRSEQASRKGLTINRIDTDTTVPQTMIEEAESLLRLELIAKVKGEKDKIEVAMDRKFRISGLSFGAMKVRSNASNMRAMVMASNTQFANEAASASYGSGFNDDDALGNASKVNMQVNVVLSVTHLIPQESPSLQITR